MYDNDLYYGVILDIYNDNYRIQCLQYAEGNTYKFEPEPIWYDETDILGLMETVPSLINSRGIYKI
jgi:hypothetical protein